MQCVLVVSYQCFGTTYQYHLQGSSSPRRAAVFLGYFPLKI